MNVEPTGSSPIVTGAIRQAARLTGADFRYLLATARVESNLNATAQVATSSARGLFQFIDQTWLATLKEQGPALGYEPYANAIARTPSGDYAVTDPRMINAVMNLRSDPNANAMMAGAFTRSNGDKLAARLGRNPSEGELYIAHFLGSTGAARMIALADARPGTPAAAVFPTAAHTNPSIFYDRRGQTRSVSEVYRVLVGRYQVARGGANVPTPVAGAGQGGESPAPLAPDSAPVADAYAAAARVSSTAHRNVGPIFHSLFRTGENQPIAPVVSALWTTPPPDSAPAPESTTPAPTTPDTASPSAASGPLDLFQDQPTDARALFRGGV